MRLHPDATWGAAWRAADAPRLQLLTGVSPERAQARQQARAALQASLALELGCAPAELHLSNQRGQAPQLLGAGWSHTPPYCSISHAPGLALLAWRWQGPVGVDVQACDSRASRAELLAVARLFLEPNTAQSLAGIADTAHFLEAFTDAWTQHEARLKCAGLGLQEWSPALAAECAGQVYAPIDLAPVLAGYRAAAAWSPAHPTRPTQMALQEPADALALIRPTNQQQST